jgi:hypothetical protein
MMPALWLSLLCVAWIELLPQHSCPQICECESVIDMPSAIAQF